MKVFVVMGNDFPDAVFATNELAEAHCEAMRKQDAERDRQEGSGHRFGPRIHWRVYSFDLQGSA